MTCTLTLLPQCLLTQAVLHMAILHLTVSPLRLRIQARLEVFLLHYLPIIPCPLAATPVVSLHSLQLSLKLASPRPLRTYLRGVYRHSIRLPHYLHILLHLQWDIPLLEVFNPTWALFRKWGCMHFNRHLCRSHRCHNTPFLSLNR
jgi:hypothetical protein